MKCKECKLFIKKECKGLKSVKSYCIFFEKKDREKR